MGKSTFLSAAILTLLTTHIPLSQAFVSISAPFIIQAGSAVTVSIVNNLSGNTTSSISPSSRSSRDADFKLYNLYLSIAASQIGRAPSCILSSRIPINETRINVTIPSSVGPSSAVVSVYSFLTIEYNQDATTEENALYQYSNKFGLEGGTAVFTQFELDGLSVGTPEWLPCSAYDCARKCSQDNYSRISGDQTDEQIQATFECTEKCPGTTYPSWGGDTDESLVPYAAPWSAASRSQNESSTTSSTSSISGSAPSRTSAASSTSSTTSNSNAGSNSFTVEKLALALLGSVSMIVLVWL